MLDALRGFGSTMVRQLFFLGEEKEQENGAKVKWKDVQKNTWQFNRSTDQQLMQRHKKAKSGNWSAVDTETWKLTKIDRFTEQINRSGFEGTR